MRAQCLSVSISRQSEHSERFAVVARQRFSVLPRAHFFQLFLEPCPYRVDRVRKILPAGWGRCGTGRKCAGFAFPTGIGALRLLNFLYRHAGKIIVTLIELPHVIETKPSPGFWIVGLAFAAFFRWRPEFAGLFASGDATGCLTPGNPAVEPFVPSSFL